MSTGGHMARPEHLVYLCLVYTLAASNEYWLINWLGVWYNIKLAIFFALLQNSTWPVQMLVYWYERRSQEERVVTSDMVKSYLTLGILSSFITISRTIGLTTLPPTIYVICANTEIVFETIMTKVILRKEVTLLQLFAVCLVVGGVSVSLYNPVSKQYGHNENISRSDLTIGVTLSLASRFASSISTISAEKLLGKDMKSYFGVLEVSIANSVIPSLLLPLALVFVPEMKDWKELTSYHGGDALCIAALCVGIAFSKYADRLSKFSIVHSASTLFYAVVDANMKVVAGIGSFFFFNEKIYWPQILGFTMIVGSMVVSVFNKYLINRMLLMSKSSSFELTEELDLHLMMATDSNILHTPQHRSSSEKKKAFPVGSGSTKIRNGYDVVSADEEGIELCTSSPNGSIYDADEFDDGFFDPGEFGGVAHHGRQPIGFTQDESL